MTPPPGGTGWGATPPEDAGPESAQPESDGPEPDGPGFGQGAASGTALRRGWTTGACATAATRAAFEALVTGDFPDPVEIDLPRGQRPSFALAFGDLAPGHARAGVVKDAGDDPDVTHGLTIVATIRPGPAGSGVRFFAGEGVGTVTLPGLPLDVGEPAINPVPRRMMTEAVEATAARLGVPGDVTVEISVPGGEEVATRTWNPRLGIRGGISILGTTGIVIPYSCSAWIHSIHRGVDLARAVGHAHIAGCTGSTSEEAVQAHFGLAETAMIDMGDFAGGLLKYVRRHPVPRLSIGGGFAKLTKLAQGSLDLHSGRSQVDFDWLAGQLDALGAPEAVSAAAGQANTAMAVLALAREANIPLAHAVAVAARNTALATLDGAPVDVGVLVVDRSGHIRAETP